jgi:ribosomal protein S5
MQTISSVAELKLSIRELEARSIEQEFILRNAATETLESLNPINMIRSKFNSAVKTPGFGKSVLINGLGLAAGILSKKIFLRGSTNIFKKVLGTVVELGVAKAVANNADTIKSGGMQLLKKVVK